MSSRLIAIGDIHGCSQALEALLDALAPQASDTLVTLGDYIDRGPDSRGLIDYIWKLKEAGYTMPCLRGNHEQMLLDEDIPESHLDFIRSCWPYFETPEFIFLHANYEPHLKLPEQPPDTLFWKHLMYGIPARHESGKIVVVGHTPQPTGEVLKLEHLVCLDTYCFGNGYLTAMDLHSGQVWQADKFGRRREDVNSDVR